MTVTAPLKSYLPDNVLASAPELPTDRPPTKQECWDRYEHLYGSRKTPEALVAFCREAWAWHYLEFVNFKGWRKQPDWVEGEPIIAAATPTKVIAGSGFVHEVERLWQTARSERKAAA